MRNGEWRFVSISILAVLLITLLLVGCGSDSDDSDGSDGDSETTDGDTDAPDTDGDQDGVADGDSETSDGDLEPEQEAEAEALGPYEALEGQGSTLREMLGVSTHMSQREGENAQRDFEFERYVEIGGANIREDYHWETIEPVDDEWHFEVVEKQVEMAKERNMRILAMLAYGVDWATEDSNEDTIDPANYADFAGNLAAHFCDDIKDYELWNEPNISRFWSPEPNPATYGALFKAGALAIKEVCPDARVYYGGVCAYSLDDVTDLWWFIYDHIAAFPDICDYMDVISIHPYTLMQKPSPEWDGNYGEDLTFVGQSGITAAAREAFATAGCGDLPVVYSEHGWPSYELTEDEQGYFLARSYLLAARDNVESYYWYTFWDGYPTTEGLRPHEDYFGLFGYRGEDGTNRRAKASWYAMKGLADVLGDHRFARDLSETFELPTDVYALAFVNEDGDLALAVWDGRDNPDEGVEPPMEGGPDTSFDLALPLPDWATSVGIFDITGAEVESRAVSGSVDLTLTRSVLYIKPVVE